MQSTCTKDDETLYSINYAAKSLAEIMNNKSKKGAKNNAKKPVKKK